MVAAEGHNAIATIKLFELIYYSIENLLDIFRGIAVWRQFVANFLNAVSWTESFDLNICRLTISGDGQIRPFYAKWLEDCFKAQVREQQAKSDLCEVVQYLLRVFSLGDPPAD